MAKIFGAQIIAVIGGTGNIGYGLALGWARAGHKIVIGSRDATKGEAAAEAISAEVEGSEVIGRVNAEAAQMGEIVVVTVPHGAQATTLREIRDAVQDKIVIDTTVPLVPPKVSRVALPPSGSAARDAQTILGENVRLCSAFHNIAAAHLRENHAYYDCDILVFGDSREARDVSVKLVEALGLRGLHAGPIDNSVVAEALTSTLIFINRHYKADGAGIRITGVGDE